jgi:outer membrane protein assembly factor BamB
MFIGADWPSDEELAANWPVFRGSGSGTVTANVPADWDGLSGRDVLWKTPIPLPGQSSPIVWNDFVFLTGATKEQQEVFCFDATSGDLRWRRPIGRPDPSNAPDVMTETGYAASTMTTDGHRAFAIFPTGDIAALDFGGTIIWSKNLGMPDSQYGYASSLAMWRDRLIVQYDQGLEPDSGKSVLFGLDAATGEIIWRTPRPVANSWTSPIVALTPNGPQIITAANPWVIAYEPERGTEIWRAKCLEGDVAPSPAYANGIVFVGVEGARFSAIKAGGAGDVTQTHIAWTVEDYLPDIVSPVATDQYVFVVGSSGMVSCYDARDGTVLWEHEFGEPFHASPIIIDGVVYLTDRQGTTHRFEAAAKFKLLNTLPLGEDVSATLAVANDQIYIRGDAHLYGIGAE